MTISRQLLGSSASTNDAFRSWLRKKLHPLHSRTPRGPRARSRVYVLWGTLVNNVVGPTMLRPRCGHENSAPKRWGTVGVCGIFFFVETDNLVVEREAPASQVPRPTACPQVLSTPQLVALSLNAPARQATIAPLLDWRDTKRSRIGHGARFLRHIAQVARWGVHRHRPQGQGHRVTRGASSDFQIAARERGMN